MAYRDEIDLLACLASVTMPTTDPATQLEQAAVLVRQQAQSVLVAYPTVRVARAHQVVHAQIGYMAGYLTPAQGNAVLALFDTTHPVFGTQIPDRLEDVWNMAQKHAKAYQKAVAAQEESGRTMQLAADGITLPASDDTVTNAEATRLLAALKAKTAAEMAKMRRDDPV